MEGTFLVRLTLLLLLTVRWLTAWLLLLPLAAAAAASARSGAVPLEAPAGSLICFDSRCWHMSGSFPAAPGSLRQEDEEDSVAADGWCAAAFPSCARSVLTEIYLCRACSCHEILRAQTPEARVDETTGLPWRLGIFLNYVAPMIRQNENWALSLDPAVRQRLPPAALARLGLRPWFGAASVASFLTTVLTEIDLCHVCLLSRNIETQRTRVGYGHVRDASSSSSPGAGAREREAVTHDGDFERRLQDGDPWISRADRGGRRLE
jgi:hypothetical protein